MFVVTFLAPTLRSIGTRGLVSLNITHLASYLRLMNSVFNLDKDSLMTPAIFTFLGVVAGAVLQYFFTRHLENQKHYRGLCTQAYTDYLKSVCEQAQLAGQAQPKDIREIFARTADAKSRICLYGSATAVEAFAEFERLGAMMKTNEQRRAFTKMVAIMRTDSGSDRGVQIESLEIVLMGNHGQTAKHSK